MPEVGVGSTESIWDSIFKFCILRFIHWVISQLKKINQKNFGASESLHHEKLILPISDLGFVKNYQFSGDTMKPT